MGAGTGYWVSRVHAQARPVSSGANRLLFDQTRNDSCRLRVKSGLLLQKCRNLDIMEELGSELREFVSRWSYFCRGIVVCCVVVCVLVTTALASNACGN